MKVLPTMLLMALSVPAMIVTPPFADIYWFADGIFIGRATEAGEMLIDVEVESWLRDRTGTREDRIRVFKYSPTSCFPEPPVHYETGSKYLFLARKPFDEGGGGVHWSILLQYPLTGTTVCLDDLRVGQLEEASQECTTSITESTLIDALRTFEACFFIAEHRYRGNFVSRQECTDQEVQAWSARSPLHELLARAAMESIIKDQEIRKRKLE